MVLAITYSLPDFRTFAPPLLFYHHFKEPPLLSPPNLRPLHVVKCWHLTSTLQCKDSLKF